MNLKWNKVFIGMLFIAAVGLGDAGKTITTAEKTLYTCGMHPWIIQDHPGNCPICGMKLEPVHKTATGAEPRILFYKSTMKAGETNAGPAKDSMDMEPVYAEEPAAANSAVISLDPATIQMMNVQTTAITRGPLRRTIRTVGTIGYNETALTDVTTKFKGWIEKLDVDSTGQLVHRGETLFEIYSPELYGTEAEYLAVLDSTNDDSEAALEKLRFFDISEAQITDMAKTRKPSKTLKVVSAADGFVVEKNVVQGQMVEAGARLYRLADLGIVWVFAQVYEQDLQYVQLGQEAVVKLSSMPDREFRGRVTFVYPEVDERTRTAKVRLEFENPGYFLKPGMFVSAQIISELKPSALLVPDSAVLRSGEKNTVFVALPGGKFEARMVTLGQQSEAGNYEIIGGLREGERVVQSGQFMLDSESQLREAIEKMNHPGGVATSMSPAAETNPSAQTTAGEAEDASLVYVCPMPAHVSITYDHPGNCPICGMALVPVTRKELKLLQPGGKVLYYTCPMPAHSSVHEDKPGKCPICGMTLIPVMEAADTATNAIPDGSGSSTNSKLAAKQLYTCLMHPEVISDHPGKCPKCGMDLAPVQDSAK
jgi:multidrug efflux pump subunit AcrA (membrane-fusion protein)/rubrerythrin